MRRSLPWKLRRRQQLGEGREADSLIYTLVLQSSTLLFLEPDPLLVAEVEVCIDQKCFNCVAGAI